MTKVRLSTVKLQKALDCIEQEHRKGLRQRSVISEAILDNKCVDEKEMLSELTSELEDKDIHPDSIALNHDFIISWIAKVGCGEGLEEQSPEKESSVVGTTGGTARSPVHARVQLADNSNFIAELDSIQKRKATGKSSFVAELERSGIVQSPEQSPKNLRRFSSERKPPIPKPKPSFLRSQSQILRNLDDEQLPKVALQKLSEELLAPPGDDDRSSRRGSVSSHQSKPDEWHPSDQPDPDYVRSMLSPYFEGDPFEPSDPYTSIHRLKRAFRQQDWSDRGFLTRKEVMTLCQEVLEYAEIYLNNDRLQMMIATFDANKDGQFVEQKFIALMVQLIEDAEILRKDKLICSLIKLGDLEKVVVKIWRAKVAETLLPWGWRRNSPKSDCAYSDEISGRDGDTPPIHNPRFHSFTVMALDADFCVERINNFEGKWLKITPRSLQTQFLRHLRTVRNMALNFTQFENHEDRFKLSELDATILCYDLTWKFGELQGKMDVNAATKISESITRLMKAQDMTQYLLQYILGFVYCLDDFSNIGIEPSTQNFPHFFAKWKSSHVEWYSKYIGRQTQQWEGVSKIIAEVKRDAIFTPLEICARQVAQAYLAQQNERKVELDNTHWTGRIGSAALRDFEVSRRGIRGKVENPSGLSNDLALC